MINLVNQFVIFEKKKINIETLSEYLREVRSNLQLSFEEVAKKTGIKPKFLQSLEQGTFSVLPPNVYVFGFLKQLAELYSVEPETLIEQYRKERNIQQHIQNQSNRPKTWAGIFFGKLIITPKYMSVSLGLVFVVVTVAYIIWQVLSINRTPGLVISQPQDRQIISGTFVDVVGKTDPGIKVSVNGQDIFVDNKGGFKTQLGISAGPKDLVITAKNKFDKSITKTISVIGQDPNATAPAVAGQLQLKLEFSADVTISFIADDLPSQTVAFHKGDVKLLTAKQKIVLSTTNAGATKVTLNNQLLGPLGRPNESLQNIPFTADSAATNPLNNANK